MLPACFKLVAGGIEVQLQCTPRARRQQIGAIIDHPRTGPALKVTVTVPAEDGKANQAIIALLAKHWHVPKTSLRLESGGASRSKRFLVAGDSKTLQKTLESWYQDHQQQPIKQKK